MAAKNQNRDIPRPLSTSCKLSATGNVAEIMNGFATISCAFDDFFKSTKCKGYKVPSQGKADETTGMQNSRLG